MKKTLFRALLCLLTVATILGATSCSDRGETLLSLEKDGIEVTFSVNAYRLMLGRTKATLAEVQNVGSADFWNSWIGSPAKTMDQYYRDNILENCKTYLVSLFLFEKYGLELSDAELAEVETLMQEFIKTDGDGSKTKLNAVLSEHGVNYDILEDVYLMQAKIEKLQAHLYGENASLVGDDIKTAYMLENYVHYKQIFLPFTTFVYETDKNGDDVYYKPSEDDKAVASDKIFYNTSMTPSSDTDKNGDTVYYFSNGKIAYNTVDGIRKKLTDEDGNYKTRDLTDTEKKALKTERDTLLADLKDSSNAKFEQTLASVYEAKDLAADQNTDGYYIRRSTYSGASVYLNDVISALDEMKVGDVGMVESTHG
ncbi:MAG: hypothetical protein IJW16_05950, partial [Clostridia bacterium]|nr:hypothetical protein [Clostridia bacterium]